MISANSKGIAMLCFGYLQVIKSEVILNNNLITCISHLYTAVAFVFHRSLKPNYIILLQCRFLQSDMRLEALTQYHYRMWKIAWTLYGSLRRNDRQMWTHRRHSSHSHSCNACSQRGGPCSQILSNQPSNSSVNYCPRHIFHLPGAIVKP